jgi:hypothetical protein
MTEPKSRLRDSQQTTMAQALAERRAVVLGASNVMRNLSTVVETARLAAGEPLDLLIAAGHGRSYGMANWVLGYSLPGIIHCGLWSALKERSPAPTMALITDIGNDILYGAPPEMILAWVELCLSMLAAHDARMVITELPMQGVLELRPLRFGIARTVSFPGCRLSLQEVFSRTICLNSGLIALADKFGATIVQPAATWYGFDPIHFRRAHALRAWQSYFAPWSAAPEKLVATGSYRNWLRWRTQRFHRQRFLQWERERAQPIERDAIGNSLSLY